MPCLRASAAVLTEARECVPRAVGDQGGRVRVWRILSRIPSEQQKHQLEELLTVTEGMRQSDLDRLRRAPVRVSGPSLVGALERLDEIRALGMGSIELERIPDNRIKALARFAAATWAPRIARMPNDRRTATLVAFAHVYEATATDDALDVFDMLAPRLRIKPS